MAEFKCDDPRQCFEPCGDLGHDAAHARRAPEEIEDQLNAAIAPLAIQHLQQAKRFIAQQEETILDLHRKLASERLHAGIGWQRYEAKNREVLELRESMVPK